MKKARSDRRRRLTKIDSNLENENKKVGRRNLLGSNLNCSSFLETVPQRINFLRSWFIKKTGRHRHVSLKNWFVFPIISTMRIVKVGIIINNTRGLALNFEGYSCFKFKLLFRKDRLFFFSRASQLHKAKIRYQTSQNATLQYSTYLNFQVALWKRCFLKNWFVFSIISTMRMKKLE